MDNDDGDEEGADGLDLATWVVSGAESTGGLLWDVMRVRDSCLLFR